MVMKGGRWGGIKVERGFGDWNIHTNIYKIKSLFCTPETCYSSSTPVFKEQQNGYSETTDMEMPGKKLTGRTSI